MSLASTLAIVAASLTCGSGDYAWPMALDPQLTSSFAEYRTGRFHAGIDLRTAGVGREVYAAGDGYISRVRCSPYGYGKAVYLQLADGNTAVYAHLSDYYPELKAVVQREQHRARNYTVDIQLAPSAMPVKKGQLIAKSGQTGIGAPHLHFEMRDANQAPVNPRLLGFEWPDATPPVIKDILVVPKGLEGRVNGDVLPVTLAVSRDSDGHYRTGPVRASGLLGFGANVTDPGSGGYNLGVHRLALTSGGDEIFRMQHDRMSYENHRNGAVAYHPYLLDQGRFLVLWRWPGNTCDSYQHSRGEGWLEAGPETGEVKVEATDFYGNSVSVHVPLLPPEDTSVTAVSARVPAVDLSVWGPELLVSAVGLDATVPPVVHVGPGPGSPFTAFSGPVYRTAFRPEAGGVYPLKVSHPALSDETYEVGVFIQGERASTLELGDLHVSARPDSPYGALFLRAWVEPAPPPSMMAARSAAYRLWPEDAPIFDPITVSFPLHEGVPYRRAIQIYRYEDDRWSREETTYRNGRVELETRSPGLFMALEDVSPPAFANVLPAEGLTAQSRRPEIRAGVTDDGSGIASYTITCGERWLLTAYDPEHDQIYWERDEDLPPGPQRLIFTVTDEAGNARTYTRQVVIPGP